MQKNTVLSIIVSIAIIGGTFYFVSRDNSSSPQNGDVAQQQNNVEIKDGVQYVTINAHSGYSPRMSSVQSGLPTKLIVKTNGTYDCSLSLVIRQIGFQKILQPTGEEVVDLGTLKSGEKVQGVCGMGMFNFQIKVS